MELTLTRESGDKERTMGKLRVGAFTLHTVERPWLYSDEGQGGVRRQSCVPVGKYTIIPHHSQNFPNTYALVNHELGVWYQPHEIPAGQKWGRSAILIHIGNRVRDVIGCIAVGMDRGTLHGEPAVLRSTQAMRELDRILGRHNHTLVIS